MTKFLMFTKESCGPCGLVKKYITALKDPRESIIEEIDLEDFSNHAIPEENLALAKKYSGKLVHIPVPFLLLLIRMEDF